jgi:RNA polymerase sigma factor FliA
MPAHVEHADLVSYGIFGLMDAIEKFEPGRGFKFETYAVSRIRGAIIDELRSVDWVPRSVRTRSRQVEAAMQVLESTSSAAPPRRSSPRSSAGPSTSSRTPWRGCR